MKLNIKKIQVKLVNLKKNIKIRFIDIKPTKQAIIFI